MSIDEVSNKAIYELLQSVLKKSETIENQAVISANELKQEIRNLRSDIKGELETIKRENEEIKQENQILKNRLVNAERKLKKYNLIFYGIKEEGNKIEETNLILTLINNTLAIDCRFADIRDHHRIGPEVKDKNRPIVIEFVNYQLKCEILNNGRNLKGTGIFVANDYIPEEYQQRKVLRENLKIARDNKFEAYIKNNVLIVNGENYTYEDLKKSPVVVHEEGQMATEPETQNRPSSSPNTPVTASCNFRPATTSETSFKDLINSIPKTKKRKEQPIDSEHQLKRSTRLMKLVDEKK